MMEPLYKHAGVEERWQRIWEEERLYHADPDAPGDAYVIAVPPPNVTGALHMGHALNALDPGRARPLAPDARLQHALAARLRPCRHRDPGGGGARAARARGRPGSEIGREAFLERVWEWLHEYGGVIMGQFRRLGCSLDYERERFTMDERVRARGHALLRAPVRARLDVPRQPHRQLVQRLPHVHLRPGGGAHRRRRRTHVRALSARRRLRPRHRGDGAARDDPRRRRRGRAPRRRAVSRSRRQGGDRAGGGTARARDRRRARRARVRHGRAQDHPGPRPGRLRDRPRPWAADALRDRPRRPHDRRHPGDAHRARRGGRIRLRRRLAPAGRAAREARELPPRGRPLRAQRARASSRLCRCSGGWT